MQLEAGMMVTTSVRLVRPLGAGGMGSVWVAEHLSLRTEVVVKFMSAELAASPQAAARFSREAASAAQAKSPHVVQMHDHGITPDGHPYIVMEMLEGRDLGRYLAARGRLPPRELAIILDQIAKALLRAHERGIVHRDIKPDNVFLCDTGSGDTFVKLLDFGIAKSADALEGMTTSTAAVVGTPYYMSPEQVINAKTIDLHSDLWSLGVLAFKALTGELPFFADSFGALALAIHHGPIPKPSSLVPSLPAAVDAWFLRACCREPEGRFASAREMADAFASAVGETPAGATGASRPRVRPVVWAALGSLVLLAVGVAFAVQQADVGRRLASSASSSASMSTPPSTSAGARAETLASVPVRHACDSDAGSCGAGMIGWCDAAEHQIACCARDLVATGTDGICACPPGGVSADAGASGCPTAVQSAEAKSVDEAIANMRPSFRRCYDAALASNASLAGRMTVRVRMTPEGRVYEARIVEGRMASPEVQACVLREIRLVTFSPPVGGAQELLVPITFTNQDAGADSGAPLVPGRHPCRARGACSVGTVAWCGANESELACCAVGLVALGRDGMCVCPAAGDEGDAGPCPPSLISRAEWRRALGDIIDGVFAAPFRSCTAALDAGVSANGKLIVDFGVGPSGEVVDARLKEGSVRDPDVQRCALEAIRSAKLPPPVAGWEHPNPIEIVIAADPKKGP